jgi:arginine transport system substrate-binding protein
MKILNKILTILAACCVSTTLAMAADKPLVLATEATYPPFESMNSQGQMIGFDIDILKAVCEQMNRTCKFVNQPWDSLIPGLQLGKFDVIFGSMNITPERQQQVDFTIPYYASTGSFIGAAKLKIQDLIGKTVGVQGGTTYDYYMQAVYGKKVTINRYGSIQDAFLDLQSGRLDAIFGDTPIMLTWLKNPANTGFAIIGEPVKDPKFFNSGYGFAVKKGNTELLNQLNTGIQTIKANGALAKIQNQYFGKNQ